MPSVLSSPKFLSVGATARSIAKDHKLPLHRPLGVLPRVHSKLRHLMTASMICATAVGIAGSAAGKNGVPIQLEAKDGSMSISGNLLEIDGGTYSVETTLFGILQVKIAKFKCSGNICPAVATSPAPKAIDVAKPAPVPKAIDVVKATSGPSPVGVTKAGNRPALFLADTGSKTQRLLSLIAIAEATHRGYDTVQLRARVPPPAPPTSLTMGEIKKWVKATPGQQHAIGRYQFIPPTFNSLQRRLKLSDKTRFSPDVQDKMATVLLQDAGYRDFLSGKMHSDKFMDSLAAIWAGLPLKSGRSKYHGYAGNKASISRRFFAKSFSAIFQPPRTNGRRG